MIPSYTTGLLIYKATRDGFANKAFHDRCDNKPNTIIIIRNNLNFVFGGFTASRWNSNGEYIEDQNSFILSLRRNGTSNNYKLMIQAGNSNYAIYGHSSYGPTFGNGNDIYICDQSNIYNGSSSTIWAYTPPAYPSGSNYQTFLTGGFGNWLTTEIEVYQIFK